MHKTGTSFRGIQNNEIVPVEWYTKKDGNFSLEVIEDRHLTKVTI